MKLIETDKKEDRSRPKYAPMAHIWPPYNPSDPRVIENPYPVYDILRTQTPVVFSEPLGLWLVTGYREVISGLSDRRLVSGPPRLMGIFGKYSAEQQKQLSYLRDNLSQWLGFMDPPGHTPRRNLINRLFTPRAMQAILPRVERIAEGLIHKLGPEVDLVEELAVPLPLRVICELLLLPQADYALLKKWSDDLARFVLGFHCSFEQALQAQSAAKELADYLRKIVEKRVKNPGADIISQLVADPYESLSIDEVLAQVSSILFAGHETTTNLIANGLLGLMKFPHTWNAVSEDRSLSEAAVEEALRYDSPVQWTARYAITNVLLGEKIIPKGSRIMLFLAAANRDPRKFPRPHQFILDRPQNAHLSFGYGIHFCSGAYLARQEASIAFGLLAKRFPQMQLVDAPLKWRACLGMRSLESLWVHTR